MAAQLYLGNRRYSSWSLRGWLAVRLAGLEAEDIVTPLAGGTTPALAGLTPAGLVPALRHDGIFIWDSLAICEYCAEHTPSLWPTDRATRAVARSVAAEMHAGFSALRTAMPMNLFRANPNLAPSAAVTADITRIDTVWQQCLATGGRFLFGPRLTIPDIMYAPVVARFLTYTPPLSEPAAAYCRAIRATPELQHWYSLAEAETWRLPQYE